jgi:hypothetical protein
MILYSADQTNEEQAKLIKPRIMDPRKNLRGYRIVFPGVGNAVKTHEAQDSTVS